MTPVVWRKSSRSGGMGSCVEVADLGHELAVRDSKLVHRETCPTLAAGRSEWSGFLDGVKRGAFDL